MQILETTARLLSIKPCNQLVHEHGLRERGEWSWGWEGRVGLVISCCERDGACTDKVPLTSIFIWMRKTVVLVAPDNCSLMKLRVWQTGLPLGALCWERRSPREPKVLQIVVDAQAVALSGSHLQVKHAASWPVLLLCFSICWRRYSLYPLCLCHSQNTLLLLICQDHKD